MTQMADVQQIEYSVAMDGFLSSRAQGPELVSDFFETLNFVGGSNHASEEIRKLRLQILKPFIGRLRDRRFIPDRCLPPVIDIFQHATHAFLETEARFPD